VAHNSYHFIRNTVGERDEDVGSWRKDAYGDGSMVVNDIELVRQEFIHGVKVEGILFPKSFFLFTGNPNRFGG
jgi:hypothetical protein